MKAEHIAEKETEETEMKAVQSLLEAGEYDTEMEMHVYQIQNIAR